MIDLKKDKIMSLNYLLNKVGESRSGKNLTPTCCLFLGSGCSIDSGVPIAKEIILLCQKLSFIMNEPYDESLGDLNKINSYINKHERHFTEYVLKKERSLLKSIEANKDDYIESLPKNLSEFQPLNWEFFKGAFFNDLKYGFWFEQFSEDPRERQKFIEQLVDDKHPQGPYVVLSYLIAQGIFTNVFTTNFDDFIADALMYYCQLKPRVFAHNEIAQYINIFSDKPNIVKLHGDFLFENIKNTNKETSFLEKNLDEKLREALVQLNLIVVGYSGSDFSIMNALNKIKSERNFGLYWCGRNTKNLHWRVADLLNRNSNSFFVEIPGFDYLVAKIWKKHGDKSGIPDIEKKIQNRKFELNEYLQRYELDMEQNDINITSSLPNQEINSLSSKRNRTPEKNVSFEWVKTEIESLKDTLSFLTRASKTNELIKRQLLRELRNNLNIYHNASLNNVSNDIVIDMLSNEAISEAHKQDFSFRKIRSGKIEVQHVKDDANRQCIGWTAQKLFYDIDESIEKLKNLKKLNHDNRDELSNLSGMLIILYFRMKLMADFIRN
jgi:hypothetical protein